MKYLRYCVLPVFICGLYCAVGMGLAGVVSDGVMATLAVDIVVGLALWFWYRRRGKDMERDVTKAQIAVTFLLVPVVWLITQVTASCLILIPGMGWEEHQAAVDVDLGGYVLLTFIGAPLLEEVLFRGIVYRDFKKAFGMFPAMFLSCALFGLVHGNLPQFYVGMMDGLFFCMVYECSGRLWTATVVHAVHNIITLVAQGVPIQPWMLSPAFLIGGNVLLVATVMAFVMKYGRVSDDAVLEDAAPETGDGDGCRGIRAGDDAVVPSTDGASDDD